MFNETVNPLSPFIAELFLNNLETNSKQKSSDFPMFNNPIVSQVR